jgi:hypothetical protein
VCLALGDLASEQQQFMGFQDQTYLDSDLFFCEQKNRSKYCMIVHIPIIVVLHAFVYECAPMIRLARIVLSFLEALALYLGSWYKGSIA